jgi:hypothetical protein
METYTEAASKFIKSATAFMAQVRLFAEAKRAYELWQKEIELVRVRKEIDALKLVIPLLVEQEAACQIEHAMLGESAVMPCGKRTVARCVDCGVSICSDCRLDCCGDSFCEPCHNCQMTSSCLRKPVQNERYPLRALRPRPNKAG